jgi:hypothetical protein
VTDNETSVLTDTRCWFNPVHVCRIVDSFFLCDMVLQFFLMVQAIETLFIATQSHYSCRMLPQTAKLNLQLP